MELLPVDVVKIIFYKLEFYEQLAFKSTCKKYYALQIKKIPHSLHAKLTDDILSRYPGLEGLVLENNDNITDTGLSHVPNLIKLLLCRNSKITDAGIKYCKNLQCFLTFSDNISDDGINHLTQLKEITIHHNFKITNAIILNNVKNLRLLKLSDCNMLINDDVLQRLSNLEYLYINTTPRNYSDTGIYNLKKLKMLITTNRHITEYGISQMKNLQFLCLSHHTTITQVPENCIVLQRPFDGKVFVSLHAQVFNNCNFLTKYHF